MSKRQAELDKDLMFNAQGSPSHPPNPTIPYPHWQQAVTMDPPPQKQLIPGNTGIGSAGVATAGGNTAGFSAAGPQTQDGFGGDVAAGKKTSTLLPAVRSRRTNTPWTPAEEQRLKTMRDAQYSWIEIAKTFPTRTEGSVKKHWYKDMHYAEFGEDESAALLTAIKDYESSKWKVIGQKVGKPAKACEQYAKEHFSKRV